MSHSKRNTTRPVFTSYERNLAKSNWAPNSARLSRDSFLPFGSCGLCLKIARDPVACPQGDIFCRECVLANLLAQKKDLRRIDKVNHEAQQEAARIRAVEDEEDKERAVRDFEMTQAGLKDTPRTKRITSDPSLTWERDERNVRIGSKRKISLDGDELGRIAQEDRAKARKAIEDEKASKPTLPSFWTPSLTPDVRNSKLMLLKPKAKRAPTCPSSTGNSSHSLSLQNLASVHFTEDLDASTKNKQRVCPSCCKALSNSSTPVMAEKCGHVFCLKCVKEFLMPLEKSQTLDSGLPITCFVCDVPVTIKMSKLSEHNNYLPPGLIGLRSEGTGFSARGSNTVEKTGTAFQC